MTGVCRAAAAIWQARAAIRISIVGANAQATGEDTEARQVPG